MKVSLSKYRLAGDSNYDVQDKVTCSFNGNLVEVRQTPTGMVIVIQGGKVSMEPRAAGIWLVVDEPR
jgi:hypothetical protein